MLKQEIRKILKRRIGLILFGIFILFQLFFAFSDFNMYKNSVDNFSQYNKMLNDYAGTSDIKQFKYYDEIQTPSQALSYIQSYPNIDGSTYMVENQRTEDAFKLAYARYVHKQNLFLNDEYVGINTLAKSTNEIDKRTYEMLSKLEIPKFANQFGMNWFFIQGGAMATMVSILCIVMFSNIYSIEKAKNMDKVIRSSYVGLKNNKMYKVLACNIIMAVLITIFFAIFIVVYLILYNEKNIFSLPLNSINLFLNTPYNITVLEALIENYLRLLLGGLASTNLMCIFLYKTKSQIFSFIISVIVIFLPFVSPKFGPITKLFILSPIFSMQPSFVLEQYMDYSIFGKILTYRSFSFIVLILINVVCFLIIYKLGKGDKYERTNKRRA